MNVSLKPLQLIAHWIPGFVLVSATAFAYEYSLYGWHLHKILTLFDSTAIVLIAIFSFVVGQIIDSIRNCKIEDSLDKKDPVNWDFLFYGDEKHLSNLGNYFFDYYLFDVNIALSLFLSPVLAVVVAVYRIGTDQASRHTFVATVANWTGEQWLEGLVAAVLVSAVWTFAFWWVSHDAEDLRKNIARFTRGEAGALSRGLPHEGVYVRLKASDTHGVGVFAIKPIPKGTDIFPDDNSEILWRDVDELKLNTLPPGHRRLYEDFCIIQKKGRRYGCPSNFNLMTVAWYLNHSNTPNVRCDEDFRFFALRNITEGEELTADYRTYNDFGTPPDYIVS